MEHIQPFTFERVFALNSVGPSGNDLDLHLQVLSLQAQIDEAEQLHSAELVQARADGFASGLAQARSEIAAATVAAAETMSRHLEDLAEQFGETEAKMSRSAAEVALAAAEVLAARAVAVEPMAAISAALDRVLTQVGYRQSLEAYVHPSLVAPLETLVEARQEAAQRSLTMIIHGDPNIPPGDARICWEQGGLSLDAADRNRAIRAELGLLLPSCA